MDAIGVPVTPCQGTMMAWVDFRKYLRYPKDAAAEKELWLDLCENQKIIFTSGESCKTELPGFFRVCFAYPDIGDSDDLQIAMKELKRRLVNKFRPSSQPSLAKPKVPVPTSRISLSDRPRLPSNQGFKSPSFPLPQHHSSFPAPVNSEKEKRLQSLASNTISLK